MGNRGGKSEQQGREKESAKAGDVATGSRRDHRHRGKKKKDNIWQKGLRHVQKMGATWVGEGPSGNREGTNMGRKADHKGRTTAASMGICLNDNTRFSLRKLMYCTCIIKKYSTIRAVRIQN